MVEEDVDDMLEDMLEEEDVVEEVKMWWRMQNAEKKGRKL